MVTRSGSTPSWAAGSEQGIVASEERSCSSGNLLESVLFTMLSGGGKLAEFAVDGRGKSWP